jgi:4a-hydroxytetrahydrobiopterin dehydratase
MDAQSTNDLLAKKCLPCEGGVAACTLNGARQQLAMLNGWELAHEGKRIRKQWRAKNFMAAMDFFNAVAELAEAEGHHPDLHLESYRQVTVEIWTHAIGGLSENDFILAAKINAIPSPGNSSSTATHSN